MAATRITNRLTYSECLLLPDDRKRYEPIAGELFIGPALKSRHQRVARELFLLMHLEASTIGAEALFAPIDVILRDDTVVQPDLPVLTCDRRDLVTQRGLEGPPDLVVEILSPGTAERDRKVKADLYARFGAREYWLVSPEAGLIEVLVPGEHGYSVHCRAGYDEPATSTVLPELSVPASQAFSW